MKNVRKIDVEGTFGDHKVPVTLIEGASEWVITLFHGVYGCSSLEEGNKYSHLAHLLYDRGFSVALVESSRTRRDRYNFPRSDEWAKEAFTGKTYDDDLEDNIRAFKRIKELYPLKKHCIWGFSLGGLHGLMMPIPMDALVVSGSGDSLREEQIDMLKLPVLNSVPDSATLHRRCSSLDLSWAHFFYGTEDDTFEEESCRRLFGLLPLEDKDFEIINGADHSFRTVDGVSCDLALRHMVDSLCKKDYIQGQQV